MQNSINYTCIDNDNEIEVVIEDGKMKEFKIQTYWSDTILTISYDDLQAAINEAKDEIKELENIEIKLT